MFAKAFTRQGEPDLFLTLEYADWAAFDRGVEYFQKLAEKMPAHRTPPGKPPWIAVPRARLAAITSFRN